MSDSDSDDNIATLISNGEENFWKTYQVEDNAAEESFNMGFPTNINAAEPSTSKSKTTKRSKSSLPKPSTSKGTKGTKSKRKPKKNQAASSSSFNNDSGSDTPSQGENKRRRTTSQEAEEPNAPSTSGNSILSTILQTLSAPTATAPRSPSAPQISGFAETNMSTTTTSWPTIKTRRNPRRAAASNIAYSETDYSEIFNNVLANIEEDRSKTPPYASTKVEDINPEIELPILWKSFYKKIFKIKRFTPLRKIVEYFAKKENVDAKHIYFSINDKFVNLNVHSCCTLRYQAHDEIEGSIVPFDVNTKRLTKNESGTNIKVQLNRKVENIVVRDNLMLVHLYAQVVIKFDLTLERFKLQFDGRTIDYLHTLRDLGLEEGDCIDIRLI